mgnify:CR=1 FL=1
MKKSTRFILGTFIALLLLQVGLVTATHLDSRMTLGNRMEDRKSTRLNSSHT